MISWASSGVVATFPRYKSMASVTYPWSASFDACSFTQSFSPHHSWITTSAGNGPLPGGVYITAFTVSSPLLYDTLHESAAYAVKANRQLKLNSNRIFMRAPRYCPCFLISFVVQPVLLRVGALCPSARQSPSDIRRTGGYTPANDRHRDALSASCRARELGWVVRPLRSTLPGQSGDRSGTCLVPRYARCLLGDAEKPANVAGNTRPVHPSCQL